MVHIVVLGDAGLDVVARHHTPIAHATDTPASVRVTAGGAGANTAAWLAELGAELDATVTLVGRVGDDVAGRQVRAELTVRGVRCELQIDPDAPTCCVVVLVDPTGQRSMLPDRGASARVRPAPLPEDATHLHVSGYVLLDPISRPAGIAMLAAARAAGLSTSVDPQAAALVTDEFRTAVRGVDLLLPNADELAVLGTDLGVGAIAVTDGAAGARWIDGSGEVRVAAPAAECVDSTGAGDAFDAGLLLAWLHGGSPRQALLAGVAAGARAVGAVGAQPSIT